MASLGVTIDDNPKYGIATETPDNRGLENMPKIRDNKNKAYRQMKMVESLRKTNGRVAPRNRHAFKLAAMQRKKKAGPPMKASGSIG